MNLTQAKTRIRGLWLRIYSHGHVNCHSSNTEPHSSKESRSSNQDDW